MMTRFYSTDTRRFTSQDVVFGSISDSLNINQFIYTMNNPINFFDPWGMDRWFIDDGTDKGISLEGTGKDEGSGNGQQLILDYANNLSAAFVSSNTVYQAAQYGDEVYKILHNGVSSGAPTVFKYGTRFGIPMSVASNVVSATLDDSPAMQYSYLSSIYFAVNPFTALGSSLVNSTKSFIYDNATQEEQRVIDWATTTRGLSDTVEMPPWMMEEALFQTFETIDKMKVEVKMKINQFSDEINDTWSPENFYLHMN